MGEGILAKVWEDRWRLGTCLLPALMIVAFAHFAVLPMARHLRDLNGQLALLRQNTYTTAWLDSTQKALSQQVGSLTAFRASRESALNTDSSIQGTVDRIRGLAQKSGIEVTKTTPILGRAEPLRLLRVKIEGYSPYSGLMNLFDTLRTNHPDLFLEEMLIRQGGERADGRLESQLILNVYDRKLEDSP
jgi:hypothetical protein